MRPPQGPGPGVGREVAGLRGGWAERSGTPPACMPPPARGLWLGRPAPGAPHSLLPGLAPATPAAWGTAPFRPRLAAEPSLSPRPRQALRVPPSAPQDTDPVHRLLSLPHGPGSWRTEGGREQRCPLHPTVAGAGWDGRLWGAAQARPLQAQACAVPAARTALPSALCPLRPALPRLSDVLRACSARLSAPSDPHVHAWLPQRPPPWPPVCC